jgi:inhibitor of KinA
MAYSLAVRIEPLGDAAYIVRDLAGPAFAYAEALRLARVPGVLDVAASYETIGVYTEPGALEAEALAEAMGRIGEPQLPTPKVREIPVCYELGEDLQEVAEKLNLRADEVIRLHSSKEYQCFAVGFCPGFPYLGWLPDELQGIARRATPRIGVEPGSVAITGNQTGIYPLPRPGGWSIVGCTPLTLVDVEDCYFPISAGDRVRFAPIDQSEFERRKGERL